MSFIERETFVTVPAGLLKHNKAFGMDFGSSSVKFVYLTKEDKEQDDSSNSGTAKIRTITFARSELTEGLRFVKQRASVFGEKFEDSDVLYLTGIGCIQKKEELAEIFNMRHKIISEVAGIAASFSYMMCNIGRRHFLEPRIEQPVANALKYCAGLEKFMAVVVNYPKSADEQQFLNVFYQSTGYDLTAANDTDDVPLMTTEPGLFPCLLVGCGSATYTMKFAAPGVDLPGDLSTSGGRMLLGVANKLIGCKTYEDFMNLASKGNSFAVHQSTEIFHTEVSDKEQNFYTTVEKEMETNSLEIFSFGRLVGANCANFRDEDIASAWLDHYVQDLVRTVLLNCHADGIKRVFLCGGVISHPYVRQLVTEEMIKKNVKYSMLWKVQPVVFDFIKSPQQLCSLGCMAFDHQSRAKHDSVSGQTAA